MMINRITWMKSLSLTQDSFITFHDSGFHFRVAGRGLSVMLASRHTPLFSERMGYYKPLYIFGLRIKRLHP